MWRSSANPRRRGHSPPRAAASNVARRRSPPTRRPIRSLPLPAAPMLAPRDGPAGHAARGFTYPPTVAVTHGYRIGEHRLVLPQSPAELTRWGRRLSNCLVDYVGAVRSGQSIVIGLEERGTLAAALELRDDRVRQFVGIANARSSAARREVMERMLRDLALGGR